MKGSVASGHPLTSRAAIEMLKAGGNAFDAVISAGFASAVAEPTLSSLGGGGFLLAHINENNKDILFDFFVNTPGLNNARVIRPVMKPVEIKFPSCTQLFHTGYGSVAVPGMLKGMLYIYKRLCTLPIGTILNPALSYLEEGIVVNEIQESIMEYLRPIFTSSDYGRQMYMKEGLYAKKNDRIFNPLLKKFLGNVMENTDDFYGGVIAERLVKNVSEQDGLVTKDDLLSYRVIEREPLLIRYRDRVIITNPLPSFGGALLELSLKLMENVDLSRLPHGSEGHVIGLIELLKGIDSYRSEKGGGRTEELVRSYIQNITEKTTISTQGTTHISVVDETGNAASMTISNGSGSGCFVPGTGIMLNNMMGEEDLHPEGFFISPSGQRVSSMMSPTILTRNGKVEAALGSGGSKRIRTAILHVLINIIDYHYPLQEAIEASRFHYEDGVIQAEPDVKDSVVNKLKQHYSVNVWSSKNMYFGGVHAVKGDMSGWGDSRRDGHYLIFK
jgi:gamma-glutamyltranspeptidase/glutathione hydrolase